MSCVNCKEENKENLFLNNDCVLTALDKIKGHYLSLRNEINTKDKEIQKLQQRNEKLAKAIELLQSENLRTSFMSFSQQSPKKRRKSSVQNPCRNSENFKEADAGHCPASTNADITADDLNMALNSEQIFSCSSADSFTQLSPNRNESINETEKVNSPRVLRSSFEQRRELIKKRKLRLHQSNENIAHLANGGDGIRKTNSGWMRKEKQETSRSLDGPEKKICGTYVSFAKPQTLNGGKIDRKPSLSLKKSVKLRQTRLQLDVSREKSLSGSDTTYCEEVIDASPNPHALQKHEKPARSWLLRVSNDSSKNSSHKAIPNNQPDDESYTLSANREEDYGQVFDFTFNPPSPAQPQETGIPRKSPAIESAEGTHCELDDRAVEAGLTVDDKEIGPNSSSVMILTPATQDIIFLDDTFADNTNIASMDLLHDLLKSDEEGLENLKRIEKDKIKKLQKTASAAPKLETTDKKKLQSRPASAACSKSLSLATTKIPPNLHEPIEKTAINIKKEKTTQPTHALCQKESNKRKQQEESSEDDFMPLPILVKEEKLDTHASKQIYDAKTKSLSLKERFNIDCRDCQQYIDFLGDRMSDKEIAEHLKRCSRHQPRDVDINPTPDDFWNPFIASFDVNDPRNETLIDERFADKKK